MTPGRSVGRYTLHALLGRGGMGEVYRAFDERLRRHVAIKRVRTKDDADSAGGNAGNEPQLRGRLEREARLVAQLGHPAIVQVFDIVEDDDGDWVVMELVEGRTLAAVLDAGPLGVGEVLRHAAAIAAALDAAHRQGIVHRDLKIENVMVSDTGQTKVLDFGLAKRLVPYGDPGSAALSVEGRLMGTVRTMSPEQARGLEIDARSDLFSLGTLLYELLAGTSPFLGASQLDTLARVGTHRQTSLVELPGLAARIPPALSALVDHLLEKSAELRPASAADVQARLRALAAAHALTSPVAAPSPSKQDRETALRETALGVTASGETALGVTASSGTPSGGTALAPTASGGTPSGETASSETPSGETAPGVTAPGVTASGETAPLGPPPATRSPFDGPRRGRMRVWLAGLGAAAAVSVVLLVIRARAASSSAIDARPIASGSAAALAPAQDPRAEYERGMALLRNFHRPGAIDDATAIFQRLLRQDDGSAAAYAGLARASWYRYTFTDATRDAMFLSQAQAAAARAVALDEYLVDARVSRGLVALELGQLPQAEADFRAALTFDGKNADAYEGLARLYQHQQRLDEAEAAFRQAIALAPQTRLLYDDLGALQLERGKYQDAIPLFERSIALAPDSAYGYSNLGSVYLLLGRYPEAAARLQDALKIRPASSTYGNLGTVLFAQGLYGPAAAAFERSLAMGGAANDPLHWGNLADAYRQLPDDAARAREAYDHAIGLIDAELTRAPQDLTLRSRRALYLAKRGDCPRADAGLAPLVDAAGATAYTVFRLAVTLEICGHRPRAIAMLERALASGFSPAEIGNDPELRALRADPAYHRMIDRRGHAAIISPLPASPR